MILHYQGRPRCCWSAGIFFFFSNFCNYFFENECIWWIWILTKWFEALFFFSHFLAMKKRRCLKCSLFSFPFMLTLKFFSVEEPKKNVGMVWKFCAYRFYEMDFLGNRIERIWCSHAFFCLCVSLVLAL